MYKPFRNTTDILGFNDRWVKLILALGFAIIFPYLFLNGIIPDATHKHGYWELILSNVFSFVAVYGNTEIYAYFSRKFLATNAMKHKTVYQWSAMYTFSIIIGLFFSFLFQRLDGNCNNEIIYQNLSGLLFSVTLIMGIYEGFFWFNQRQKSVAEQERLKKENLQSQLDTLKNQVKPHFLFNSLNTLVSIIPEEPEEAIKYTQNLSLVYRYILEIKDKKLISLKEEFECARAYLDMLKIRFGENLQIEVEEGIENDHVHVIPLSLQLLIENAVKHNVISSKRKLYIRIRKSTPDLLVIENNLQPKEQHLPSTGTGLKNIQSRYALLTKKEVHVTVTESKFAVAIPIIEVENL